MNNIRVLVHIFKSSEVIGDQKCPFLMSLIDHFLFCEDSFTYKDLMRYYHFWDKKYIVVDLLRSKDLTKYYHFRADNILHSIEQKLAIGILYLI